MTLRYPLLALLAVLPQCKFDQAEHGELCIYTARSEAQVRREIEPFLQAYPGIRLHCPEIHNDENVKDLVCEHAKGDECDGTSWEVFRQSTGTLTNTIVAQKDAGLLHADVLWGVASSHVQYLHAKHDDLFRPYSPARISRVRDHVSGAIGDTIWSWFLARPYHGTPDDPLWVGIDAFSVVLCVNKRKLAELPKLQPTDIDHWGDPDNLEHIAWNDLLDPRLTNKIAAPQANKAGTGFAQLAHAMDGAYSPCREVGEPGCDDWKFLQDLDAQVAIYTKSGDFPCQLAAMKDSQIVVGITHDGADFIREDRVEGYALMDDYDSHDTMSRVFPRNEDDVVSTGFDVAVNALIERDEVKPAAQIFLDWAISPEAMEAYQESTPLVAYSPDQDDLPEDFPPVDTFAVDLRAAATNMDELKEEWSILFCPQEPEGSDLPALSEADRDRGVLPLNECLKLLKGFDPDGLESLDPEHRCAAYELSLEELP